jgi:hypothetical protein
MAKTIKIDAELLREIQAATGEPTERQAVERVLRQFIEVRQKHADLLELVGKIQFRDDYDPRALRFSKYDVN